jgi:hypothetical protein
MDDTNYLNKDWQIKKGYKRRQFLLKLVASETNTIEPFTSQSQLQESRNFKPGRCWQCPRKLDRKYSTNTCNKSKRFLYTVWNKMIYI